MGDGGSPIGARRGVKVVAFVVLAAIVFVWRPLFHGVFYRIAYSPGGLILFGGSILIATALFFASPFGEEGESSVQQKVTVLGVLFVILAVPAVLYAVPAGMVEEASIAERTMSGAEEVAEFPSVNQQNPRIVPRAVADVQTRGSVSYRQHELGTSDIARMEDGRLAWSYAIQPGPFRVKLSGHQRGVLLSDMTTMEDREMQAFDEQDFVHGQATFMHRSASWHLKKTDYWVQYRDDPVEFTHNGTAYMAFPKTGHEWKLSPIPHTVPTWEGVALVHADGTIEHLSPEEAQQSEILDGQRLYPLYNAEREASSLSYRNGIVNQMGIVGSYQGVVEVADVPSGAGNSQPFVIDLDEGGMAYVLAMEPHGESTRGLDEVWFFDADSGEARYFATGGDTLLGPERAMGIVRSEDTRTDWKVGEDDQGEFRVVEPVPGVIDGDLWWHAKVVPVDNTDVTRNVFVNAHTGEAVELHDTEAVVEFMSGADLDDLEGAENVTTEPSESDDDDVQYYVVVRDDAGNEIDRIPVRSGEAVTIEQAANGTDGT